MLMLSIVFKLNQTSLKKLKSPFLDFDYLLVTFFCYYAGVTLCSLFHIYSTSYEFKMLYWIKIYATYL